MQNRTNPSFFGIMTTGCEFLTGSPDTSQGRSQRLYHVEVRKKAKIRNRYNQVPHLTQDTRWESGKSTR